MSAIYVKVLQGLEIMFFFGVGVWTMVYGLLGINWVMAGSVRDEVWVWKSISGQRKHADIILLTIFRAIWKEMNKRTFRG